MLRGAKVCHSLYLKIAEFVCRSLVLKACPGYAQTEVQLMKQGDSMMVHHDKLCQPAHKAMSPTGHESEAHAQRSRLFLAQASQRA